MPTLSGRPSITSCQSRRSKKFAAHGFSTSWQPAAGPPLTEWEPGGVPSAPQPPYNRADKPKQSSTSSVSSVTASSPPAKRSGPGSRSVSARSTTSARSSSTCPEPIAKPNSSCSDVNSKPASKPRPLVSASGLWTQQTCMPDQSEAPAVEKGTRSRRLIVVTTGDSQSRSRSDSLASSLRHRSRWTQAAKCSARPGFGGSGHDQATACRRSKAIDGNPRDHEKVIILRVDRQFQRDRGSCDPRVHDLRSPPRATCLCDELGKHKSATPARPS